MSPTSCQLLHPAPFGIAKVRIYSTSPSFGVNKYLYLLK